MTSTSKIPPGKLWPLVTLVILVATLTAFYVISIRKIEPLPEIEQTNRAFKRGLLATQEELATHADDLNQICADQESSYIWFCYEGIGARVMGRLGVGPAELAEEDLLSWRKRLPRYNGFNLLGLGIALSATEIQRPEAWAVLQKEYSPIHVANIVDGWGFGQIAFARHSFSSATKRCRGFFADVERRSCLFGLGRSLLFSQKVMRFDDIAGMVSEAQLTDVESESVLLGLGFALGFAERLTHLKQSGLTGELLDESARMVQAGIRFGQLTRGFYDRRPVPFNEDERPVNDCLEEGRGPSGCLDFF